MKLIQFAFVTVTCLSTLAFADAEAEMSNVKAELGSLEKMWNTGDLRSFSSTFRGVLGRLETASARYKANSQHAKDMAALHAVELRLAQYANPALAEVLTNSKRMNVASQEAVDAIDDAKDACLEASKTSSTMSENDKVKLKDNVEKYLNKLERAKKIDRNILSFSGKNGSWDLNVPIELGTCEAIIGMKKMDFEDAATVAEYSIETYRGCGYQTYDFQAVGNSASKFGPFSLNGTPAGGAAPVPNCKFPKTNLPNEIKSVLKSELPGIEKGDVVVMDGPMTVEKNADNTFTKTATVRVYSKKTEMEKNNCGVIDAKITCEENGSKTARAYNEMSHYLKRAEVHRLAGRIERCDKLIKSVAASAERFKAMYEEANQNKSWRSGLSYKTRTDGTLQEEVILEKLKSFEKTAQENTLCAIK